MGGQRNLHCKQVFQVILVQGVDLKSTLRNTVLHNIIDTREMSIHQSTGSIRQGKNMWHKMVAAGTGPRGRPRKEAWKEGGTAGIWR